MRIFQQIATIELFHTFNFIVLTLKVSYAVRKKKEETNIGLYVNNIVFVTHGRQVAGVHIVICMARIDPELWSHQKNVLFALKKIVITIKVH